MTTEQTGRQDIDSTDSQARIEPTTLVAAPPGGDPTPLPRRRAAHGTRTGMRAAPPPIPDGTRPKLAAAPPRASSKSLPPPIPSKPAIEIAAHADGMMAAASKPASPLPDPDGWSLPATIEPSSGPSYPSVYHPEPAAPDVTVLTGFESAPVAAPLAEIQSEPSAEWLAKISSVLKDEAPPAAEDGERIAAAHAHAVAATAARDQADAIARAEADALARAEAEIAQKAVARAARKASESDADGDTDKSADAEAEAVALAKANAAANASLPKLPSARPSNAKLPPPRGASGGTRPPVPAVAAAAAAMFTTKDPTATSQLELVDLEPVETPAKAAPVVQQALPVVAPPVAAKPVNPLVAAAQASMDVDIDWDVREPGDMTSAHTTDFEMPVKSKMPQRAALGLFVAATFATVGYLATRSTSTPKHATPAPAAETAPAQVAAPTPAPTAAAPAEAPAPGTQAVAAPVAAPAAEQPNGPKLVQLPVSSTPSGALVTFVDGEKAEIVGRTPTTITLDASKPHDIALTMVGHETQLEHIPVGGMTALAVTLPAKAGASTPAETAPAPAARDERVTAMVPEHSETAPAHHTKAASHPAPAVERITTPAPRSAPAAPSGSGILMISSKPPCEIVVDGKSTHLQTPQRAIPLAPGTHTVLLVNAQLKIHKTVAVDIVAKKPTKVIQDFTKH